VSCGLILAAYTRTALQAFPLPIGTTTALTELRLDNNQLVTLTSSFGTLSNLTFLSARNNRPHLPHPSHRIALRRLLRRPDRTRRLCLARINVDTFLTNPRLTRLESITWRMRYLVHLREVSA
jgi:hypothetical protein